MSLQRPEGMPRVAFEAYCLASERARIDIAARDDLRLVQIIGNATASAGFHHAEMGEAGPIARLEGEKYSACYDLSVRGLNWTQVATWLEELCRAGFCAFYRYKGSFKNNKHIHANFCGLPMKPQLQQQCRSYFVQDDGLVGDAQVDDTLYPSPELVAIPKAMFAQSNGAHPQVVAAPTKREPVVTSNALYLGMRDEPALWMPVVDGVSLAPVRAYGTAMGFDVVWNPETHAVLFDGRVLPIAITTLSGVGHAPIRSLARFSGLDVAVDKRRRAVRLTRRKKAAA
jgi:hypothetical protein